MTRHPMELSPTKPSWAMEPSQMPDERYFADAQALSDLLAKNLRELTLGPNIELTPLPPEKSPEKQERGKTFPVLGLGLTESFLYEKRRGVRTVASVRRERRLRMLRVIRYRTLALLKKTPEERTREMEERTRKFMCSCNYCICNGNPPINFDMDNNYDTESV